MRYLRMLRQFQILQNGTGSNLAVLQMVNTESLQLLVQQSE